MKMEARKQSTKSSFTPGPWKRSHLTVTAVINGVHIADISEPGKFFKGRERAEEMEFCRGNAKLIAMAPDLLADLTAAAAQLRKYETLHRAKNTEDSLRKAEVNAELAARFEQTIAKATS